MIEYDGSHFIGAYNLKLERLGCGARVRRPAGAEHDETIEIVDLDGIPIGIVPDTVEPDGMAAFMLIVEQAFERGVTNGKGLNSGPAGQTQLLICLLPPTQRS